MGILEAMVKDAYSFHSYASRIGSKKRNLSRSYAQYKRVSIHTLHELEASAGCATAPAPSPAVSIHTLHELEARRIKNESVQEVQITTSFHSYASRIGSKHFETITDGVTDMVEFPFIRFTNWKQDPKTNARLY